MTHVSIQQGRRSGGLTLIEVMIGVAIAAILMATAAPYLHEMVIRNRLDTAANEFMAMLNLARSEAIRRGTDVVVGRKTGEGELENWTLGWEAYVDRDGDRSRSADEEIILESPRLSGPMTLFSVGTTVPSLIFGPSGDAKLGMASRHFVFCYGDKPADERSKRSRSRAIIVSQGGRVQLSTIDADGLPLNPDNDPIMDCRFV